MRTRHSLWTAALLTACGGATPAGEAAVQSLNEAQVVAGDRFGPLRLGRTTLREAVETLGAGEATAVAGDTTSFELRHAGGRLRLVFDLAPVVDEPLAPAVLRGAFRDFPAFVNSRQEIGEVPLSRLELRRGQDAHPLTGRFGDARALGADAATLFANCGEPLDGGKLPPAGFGGDRRFQLEGLEAWVHFDGTGGSEVRRLALFRDTR